MTAPMHDTLAARKERVRWADRPETCSLCMEQPAFAWQRREGTVGLKWIGACPDCARTSTTIWWLTLDRSIPTLDHRCPTGSRQAFIDAEVVLGERARS